MAVEHQNSKGHIRERIEFYIRLFTCINSKRLDNPRNSHNCCEEDGILDCRK